MVTTTSKKLNQLLKKLLHKPRHELMSSSSCSEFSQYCNNSSNNSSEMSADLDDDDDCPVGDDATKEDSDAAASRKDVPAGCLPVYVGAERRRFVIPTRFLSNPVFRALLAKSEEEFGLRCDGGLRIACAPDVFEHFLWWLQGDGASHS